MSMSGKNHYNIVISLQLIQMNEKKLIKILKNKIELHGLQKCKVLGNALELDKV